MKRRFKLTQSLQDRLAAFAENICAQAENLKPGPEKDDLLRRARQADVALRLDDWSTGLQPPM